MDILRDIPEIWHPGKLHLKHDSRPWQKALMKPSATLADFVKVRVAVVGISLSQTFGHDFAAIF